MIKIQEPRRLWEIFHMDGVTALQLGGDKSYNSFLEIVYSFSKSPIFLPCHKDDTAMDTPLIIWNIVVSLTVIFINIISDRYPTLPQPSGQTFTNYLEQSYPSLQLTTHKLMV
ncbi:hypothetical protein O181_027100 [Austropuccinia psidii MF-1]|uniref:Uncharacterized protein n=1 Tax=Austropuccinia psidii MF-1 TaxID=1389203 RepID=A0A9Q3CQP9_9BASI|nr:hypothetical protein [Austropuccinia psidii MF-1]